jgi:hypothetical protein
MKNIHLRGGKMIGSNAPVYIIAEIGKKAHRRSC